LGTYSGIVSESPNCQKPKLPDPKIRANPNAQRDLQVYCNTLHEEVHVLYSQLHPNIPADPIGMGAGPSGTAGEAFGGELDLFRPPPSMNLVDQWSPPPDSEATKSDKKQE
jgi:hypothetical protein